MITQVQTAPQTASPTTLAQGVRRMAGFTLIEVMITVAIVGILAAVALPSYREYVRRGQLPESFSGLADYRIKMEQYFQDNRRYGTAACADGANAPAWSNFAANGVTYFTFTCSLSNAGQGYTITATGAKNQAVGHIYTLDQDNVKGTTKFKGSAVAKSCWLLRGDEC